jgi:NO-binding membrane sensor protein with MHYT domain
MTEASEPRRRRPLPQGYRQGIITAISILLGFSLAFLRFWAFEAAGDWSWHSLASTAALVVAILLQIYALLRALRVADDDEPEYAKTVRWLVASVVVMLLGLLLAAIEASGTP